MIKSDVKNLITGELIGKELEIPLTGTKGKIIDETKHCFEIITKEGNRKKVLKNQKLILVMNKEKIEIEGKNIEMRPEERLKKIKW